MEHTDIACILDASRAARCEGNLELSNELLAKAERVIQPEDLDGLVEIWSAIAMERLGDFAPDLRDKKAHDYLLLLAEAGNVRAQEILMIDYLEGLNGLPQSFESFLFWNERAIAAGSELAKRERRKFQESKTGIPGG